MNSDRFSFSSRSRRSTSLRSLMSSTTHLDSPSLPTSGMTLIRHQAPVPSPPLSPAPSPPDGEGSGASSAQAALPSSAASARRRNRAAISGSWSNRFRNSSNALELGRLELVGLERDGPLVPAPIHSSR